MRRFLKTGLSWFVALIGFLLGFFGLAKSGMWWTPLGDWEPGWLLRWVGFVAVPLVACAFLSGSIASLRSRKAAGVIFLSFLPVAAFFLAYPDSGFLVWYKAGGFFEVPEPATAAGLTVLFYAPFLVTLAFRHDRRKAAFAFGLTVAFATLIFSRSRWWSVLVPRLFGWSIPFFLFGLFWLWTSRRRWPPLLRSSDASRPRRLAAVALGAIAIVILDVLMTFVLTALGSSAYGPDCGGIPGPYSKPGFPGHALFTARTVFVGRSMRRWLPGSRGESSPSGLGDWAIAVVEQPFWGVWSWHHYVFLTDGYYWKEQTYFIDSSGRRGLLDRHLPIFAPSSCGRSKPVEESIVDLRVMHQSPPVQGARLIGFIRQAQPYAIKPPLPPKPYVGVRLTLTGAAGTRTASTDDSGVYQFDDLPPGDYSLRLLSPSDLLIGPDDDKPVPVRVQRTEIIDRSFYLHDNGRIEGHVVDQLGKPAHVWVMVVNVARESESGRGTEAFLLTSKDGSYRVNRVPPGRYVVLINPSGPWDESPFDIQYYPSTWHRESAKIFTIGPGQRITGIDFVAARLVGKTVHLHLTWPDGSEVFDAAVCGAYEHTRDYDPLIDRNCYARSDHQGNATVQLFGNSRVRFFAEQQYKTDSDSQMYYGPRIETEVPKLPDKIDLVLKPPTSR